MVNIKDIVLSGTEYVSGYINTDDRYVISASMIGKEPLQNYLSILHGKVHNEEINDSTLGSVFHLGMEKIMIDYKVRANHDIWGIEHSMHVLLQNGWIISGTADLITEEENNHYAIHDYKLSKTYAKTMMKKELATHDYTKQLQVLEFLFINNNKRPTLINGSTVLACEFFVKDAKAINFESTHETIIVPNKKGTVEHNASTEMEKEIIKITDELQTYLESGTVPPQCSDLWWRVNKGKRIPIKCMLYCSHGSAGLCPYYDPKNQQSIERLANW